MAGAAIRISILGESKSAKKAFDDTARQADGLGSRLARSGRKVGSAFGSAFKIGAVGIITTASAAIGLALTKGFARLSAIDQARAKLTGLGHSGTEVARIMKNALTSVKGTAFGLDEAATVSAGAVAAGIKPGKELTRTLKLVGDAATIGGTSLADMGSIFNKVAASNKIQGDTIAQLQDQGIPIVQLLGKSLGKSAEEVVALASKGKINFAAFQKAMQQGVGGAALDSGKTFTGAMKNIGASISRIGAGLLGGKGGKGGIFAALAPSISGVTQALAPLEDQAGKVGGTIGRALVPVFEKLPGLVTKVVGGLTNLDLSGLSLDSGKIGPALKQLGSALSEIDFSTLGGAAASGAADTISVFSTVIGFAADHTDLLAKALPALVVAFAGYKTVQAASNVAAIASLPITLANAASRLALARAISQQTAAQAASNGTETIGTLARVRNTVATVASVAAQKAASLASKAFAAAQWLVNAALTANPIGLIIVGIAALVAGIVIAYKKSETFRKVVDTAMDGIAAAFKFMWNNVVSKILKLLLTGFIAVTKIYAALLRGLSKVPGFGWAKKAANGMEAAANGAKNLRNKIGEIKDKKVKVTADTKDANDKIADTKRRLGELTRRKWTTRLTIEQYVKDLGSSKPQKKPGSGLDGLLGNSRSATSMAANGVGGRSSVTFITNVKVAPGTSPALVARATENSQRALALSWGASA